jgi:hypothetical protein
VEAKQPGVIGAGVFRYGLTKDGMVEHPTYRDAINAGTLDAKADDAAGEHVHDHQRPMTQALTSRLRHQLRKMG